MKNAPHDPDNLDARLVSLRGDMLKFARLQLRDDAAAEDAVQESLAAALSGQKQFNNRAQIKTWVFGILKNKIIDIIRERVRSPNSAVEEIPENAYDDLFNENGFWREDTHPSSWGDPEKSFTSRQFWEIFEICLTRLPENTARIFMMREMLGFETEEICKELSVSPTNCWVVLHRARMGLRLCLEERWFNSENRHAEL
ncbi:MAG: sigma-70 family RNA polymerase sigma factor [Burkholderiales bacterium]|nr:sigma-70 family RNA polymerase sigma factor [Burkholderiales bacterium]